ncbi:MAG: peptidoglycan DD-metalloendopeptidase family protein [Bacteroidales bacterium]|nr:peptidoglycan DD-metalloendopeptidase family protein [Bacteroidales bacterium]
MKGIQRLYLLLFLSQCMFGSYIIAQSLPKQQGCFSDLSIKHKQINKYIDVVENRFDDDYACVLSLYNCDFQGSSIKKQKFLADLATKANMEINNVKTDTSILCPNIDEIYVLLGKTYYCQQQYEQSQFVFETLIDEYPQSIFYAEAYVWIAKINMCLNEFEKAEEYLDFARKNLKDTMPLYTKWMKIKADNYIRNEKYSYAIPLLEEIFQIKQIDKAFKIRTQFVLGQLYQYEENDSMAMCYFSKINKRNASDIMFAYAYVNRDVCSKLYRQRIIDSLRIEEIENNYSDDYNFEPTIVESVHDSDFINSIYPYYFNDPATMFFLDEGDLDFDTLVDGWYDDYDTTMISDELLAMMLENWDSVSIHIPKTDFKNFNDTIRLPLFDPIEGYMLPYFGEVTSRFGWRRYRYHYGIDTKNQYGEPIYCVFDGVVRIAKRSRTYGNVLVVRHENGLETFYAHSSKLLVKQNQEVKAGDIIALIGSTGRSTGPHLHFEVRYKGNPFDPEILIDFERKKLRMDTLCITKETFNYRTPYGQVAKSGKSPKNATYHRVKSGETLSGIARKYRTNVSTIKKLNGLKSDMIREGRNLRVR